jgi:probable phosphoglycerate mutase
MAKQYIYIARHGQTTGNAFDSVQTPFELLTPTGHEQAKRLAKRAETLPFSRLLASNMTRAQQTAAYIEEETNVPVETVADFREFENPTIYQTQSRQDPGFVAHVAKRIASFAADEWDWKESDEESFRDLKQRTDRCIQLFERTEENMFVVTHGHFLRFLTANILCGEHFSPRLWSSFGNRMQLTNTGISVFVRDTENGRFYLEHWNDTAHFAE